MFFNRADDSVETNDLIYEGIATAGRPFYCDVF